MQSSSNGPEASSSDIRCPFCQGIHKQNARFCSVTGSEIFRRLCFSCRKDVLLKKSGGKFCPLCGGSLGDICPYGNCKEPVVFGKLFCRKCTGKIRYCLFCKKANTASSSTCCHCKTLISDVSGDWHTFKGNPERSGFSKETLKFPLAIKWSFPDKDKAVGIVGSPVVSNGTVFFGDLGGNFYALNQYNGNLKWSRPTKSPVISSPAIDNGVVYFASIDGKVFAVDCENGRVLWVFPKKKDEKIGQIFASINVSGGYVIVATLSSALIALEAGTGILKWYFVENTADEDSCGIMESPAIKGNILVAASKSGYVYGMELSTGKNIWKFPLETHLEAGIFGSPAIYNDIAYIGDKSGRIYALDVNTGEDTWHMYTEIEGGISSSLSIGLGYIFVGTWAEYFYCLDMNSGGIRWRFRNDRITVWNSILSTPIVLINQKIVVFGSSSGYVYALDMDGYEVWSHRLEQEIISSPVVSDGFLYVASRDGILYAFHPEAVKKD